MIFTIFKLWKHTPIYEAFEYGYSITSFQQLQLVEGRIVKWMVMGDDIEIKYCNSLKIVDGLEVMVRYITLFTNCNGVRL